MKVTKEITRFEELKLESWGGAIETLKVIEENNKEEDFMNLLEDIFYEGIDETSLNDFIWFDSDYIYESLVIDFE